MQQHPSTALGKVHRDPQLVVDPSKLVYDEELGEPRSPYGVVNPNFIYSSANSVYVHPSHPSHPDHPSNQPNNGVMREQYCLCAPQTRAERRLMFIVLILVLVSAALLTTLLVVLPKALCDEECQERKKDNNGNLVDLLPFMSNPLQRMAT